MSQEASTQGDGLRRCSAARGAWLLLTASPARLEGLQATCFHRAWLWLMLIGLGWGILCVGLWELGGLAVRRSASLPLVSVLLVALATLTGLYRRALESLVALLSVRGAGQAIAATALMLTYVVFLLEGTGWNLNSASYLPRMLEWIRPQPWHRALLLAPVWGSWAMLLTVQFHRPDENTEACVAAFARRCGPATAAFTMGAVLMVSLWYFNHLSWWQFSIPLVTILTAASAGAWFCRAAGGLGRDPLLAVNLLTQMAFLAAYLVNRR